MKFLFIFNASEEGSPTFPRFYARTAYKGYYTRLHFSFLER